MCEIQPKVNQKVFFKLAIFVLAAALGALAQEGSSGSPAGGVVPAAKPKTFDYGFRPGTVSGYVDFAAPHVNSVGGLNPGFVGGAEFGLTKYVGFFGEGGYSHLSRSACISEVCAAVVGSYYRAGGGVEVVGTNHTRFVPYFRGGMAYSRVNAAAAVAVGNSFVAGWAQANAPAVLLGGGVKVYLNHHVGIDGGFSVLRSLNSNVSNLTTVAPTVGVFFQSK